ncbi:MAG: DUF2180 family protein [Planctomycetota bacterium]|nr:DUF2180 family protein [Planctomycetota bacterium]
MNCWHCERPAQGSCIKCGRGVCKEHVQSMPHIISLYKGEDDVNKAVVVGDALFCGICNPGEEPVPLEELK